MSSTPEITPCATAEIVPSATAAIVPSATPSIVPSATAAIVPSATAAIVPSATASIVPSATASIVPSATAVIVPSATAEIVPSATAVIVPSVTAEIVPSATAHSPAHSPSSQVRPTPPAPFPSQPPENDGSWYTEASSPTETLVDCIDEEDARTEVAVPRTFVAFPRIVPVAAPPRFNPIFPPGCPVHVPLPPVERSEAQKNHLNPARCQIFDERCKVPINYHLERDWSQERWDKYLGEDYVPPDSPKLDPKGIAIPTPAWRDTSQDVPPPPNTHGSTAAFEARMKIVVEEFFNPPPIKDPLPY